MAWGQCRCLRCHCNASHVRCMQPDSSSMHLPIVLHSSITAHSLVLKAAIHHITSCRQTGRFCSLFFCCSIAALTHTRAMMKSTQHTQGAQSSCAHGGRTTYKRQPHDSTPFQRLAAPPEGYTATCCKQLPQQHQLSAQTVNCD